MKKICVVMLAMAMCVFMTVPAMAGNDHHNDKSTGKIVNNGSYNGGNNTTTVGGNNGGDYSSSDTYGDYGQFGNGNQRGIGNQRGNGNVIDNSHNDSHDNNGQMGLLNQDGKINQAGFGNTVNSVEEGGITNSNGQDQGQIQGQAIVGSGNSQVNGNGVNNGNNSNNTEITFEDSKNHITGPALINSDAKFTDGKRFYAKSMNSIWNHVNHMTREQAKKILKGASDSDIEVKTEVMFERDYRTNQINKGVSGEYMGNIVIYPDGNDVSMGGMEAKATLVATSLGATHMVRSYNGFGKFANGGSWNVGIGGGASIINSDDDIAIAPNGGLGIGRAHAANEFLPEMVFELYSDETIIKPMK